jgi:predicted extracellular nuclease
MLPECLFAPNLFVFSNFYFFKYMRVTSSFFTKQKNLFTVGFYNVENLFDTVNDSKTWDDDFTPEGKKAWSYERYQKKLQKISAVLSQLGTEKSAHAPALIGLVEIENEHVLQDLIRHPNLNEHPYNFVHYDSPDERGIDTALIYNKQYFELLASKSYPLYVENKNGFRDYTRDILLVEGKLKGEIISIIVTHWPSRKLGGQNTDQKRIEAAIRVQEVIASVLEKDATAKIIILGDFNDNPIDESIQDYLVTDYFHNPMESLFDPKSSGTTCHNKQWNLFDQIIISKSLLKGKKNTLHFKQAKIFNKDWLKVHRGKLKGSPFRTYIHKWYQGGYSDHFPVYAYFEKTE